METRQKKYEYEITYSTDVKQGRVYKTERLTANLVTVTSTGAIKFADDKNAAIAIFSPGVLEKVIRKG